MEKVIQLSTPFMTLGQILKEEGIIGSGGQAKWYLHDFDVLVNGQRDDRRGRKIYPGDQVVIPDHGTLKFEEK